MADDTQENETNENTEANNDLQAGLESVASAAEGVAKAAMSATAKAPTLDLIMDVNLHVTVEVGRARMTIQDLLQLGQGSVLELQKLAGETLDIYINGKQMAHGEAVIVNEKFGVRLTEVISQEARIEGLA